MCVQKVAGASPDRWGHGRLRVKEDHPWSRGQCVCSCVTLPSQHHPLVDARAGHHLRVGAAQEEEGLEEARLVNLARQSLFLFFFTPL